jgi:nucleotide-binding universal stress UspA family protein
MFRTLLVPLDGSDLAERALPYATALASDAGGQIVLTRVALAPAPTTLDGAALEQDQYRVVEEAEQYLANVAQKLPTRLAIKTCVPYGRAASSIVDTIAEIGADVIADSAVPVFVVHARPGEMPQAAFDPLHARVIVPLDGSDLASAALPTAVELVGGGGELVLVTVVEPPRQVERDQSGRVRAYLDQQEEALTREARDYLHGVARQLMENSAALHVSIDVRVGEPATGIVAVAADRVADLVVMASHGRTGIPRAVFGSVTGAVLRDGFTPVLVVHPVLATLAV